MKRVLVLGFLCVSSALFAMDEAHVGVFKRIIEPEYSKRRTAIDDASITGVFGNQLDNLIHIHALTTKGKVKMTIDLDKGEITAFLFEKDENGEIDCINLDNDTAERILTRYKPARS